MPLVIPVDPIQAHTRQTVSLDNVPYFLDLDWSDTSASWFASLYLQTHTDPIPVVQGRRVSKGWPLLVGVVGVPRPSGDLVAAGPGDDPAQADLGTRILLYYFTAAELGRG